ncbi:MAG: hypothetical protein ACXWTY_00800 [Methylobacter sp.]
MISAYTPVLRRFSADSPDWYKHFHSVFYMSQITNQVFLSYLESKIECDKLEMINQLNDSLLESKVIRKDSDTGATIISKPDILKSIHIEDAIDQIVKNVFENNQCLIDSYLYCIGLERDSSSKKDIEIDRDLLLNTTTSKSWFELLKGLLNVWEFIFLYGAFESSFKSILGKNGQVREEALLGEVFDQFDGLSEQLGIEKDNLEKIWFFYTELRNIYVHNHGYINNLVKSNLGGKLEAFKTAIYNIHENTILLADLEKILKKSDVTKGKFYFMKDEELNIFRNTMVVFIESLEKSHVAGIVNASM